MLLSIGKGKLRHGLGLVSAPATTSPQPGRAELEVFIKPIREQKEFSKRRSYVTPTHPPLLSFIIRGWVGWGHLWHGYWDWYRPNSLHPPLPRRSRSPGSCRHCDPTGPPVLMALWLAWSGGTQIFSWDQVGQILRVHGCWGAHTPSVPSQNTSGIGAGDSPSTADIATVTRMLLLGGLRQKCCTSMCPKKVLPPPQHLWVPPALHHPHFHRFFPRFSPWRLPKPPRSPRRLHRPCLSLPSPAAGGVPSPGIFSLAPTWAKPAESEGC